MCNSHTVSLQSIRLKDFSQFYFKILYCPYVKDKNLKIYGLIFVYFIIQEKKPWTGAAVRLPTNADKIRCIYNKIYFCSSLWIIWYHHLVLHYNNKRVAKIQWHTHAFSFNSWPNLNELLCNVTWATESCPEMGLLVGLQQISQWTPTLYSFSGYRILNYTKIKH